MSARESIIPVFVPHLGCPNDCVFCNQRRISGQTVPATVETVENAIKTAAALPSNGAKRQMAFYGGSFTAIPAAEQEALLGAAKRYIDSGFLSSVRLSTRPDAIDEAVLERLSHYGVETIELGAQSLDDNVLHLSGRGHTAKEVEDASRLIKDRGFGLILQMMTGLPGDSEKTSIETAKKIIALKPDGVRIYPTVIVRDTELYDMWKTGEYSEHSVEDAVNVCSKLVPLFEQEEIPIIRMGLNPTDELSGGSAVGGAYHPALGEMVHSRIMRNKAENLIENAEGKDLVLGVNNADVSKMTGQHRCNIEYLSEKFGLKSLKIKAADVEKGEIVILSLD